MNEFESIAKEVIDVVGGLENIESAQHCVTRLRLILKDRSAVDDEKLKKVDKVKGINDAAGQLQIIFGPGIVNKVYKEVDKIFQNKGKENIEAKGGNWLQKISRLFGDIFIPIIPVLVASGILMGVRSYFVSANMLSDKSSWYTIFAVLIDTGFSFLPVLITWSSTKKFGGSQALGIVLGIMLISPLLPAAPAVGKGTAKALQVALFGLNFHITGYQNSVLMAILGGWLLSFIENKVRKIVPNVLDIILTPILTLSITMFIIFFGVGPFVQLIESKLVLLFEMLFALPFGLGGLIIGGLQQVLVITGMHNALWVIDINLLSETGKNIYQPVRNAAVLGQTGACAAFAFFAKDMKMKSNSLASTVAGLFGITEPAIFGTTLVYGKPFIFGLIGSAIGGMFSTMFKLAAPGMGATAIPGMLYFLGGGLQLYVAQSLITLLIPFILTAIYVKKEKI